MQIIHGFAQAEEDAKIFMAKWDIKDGCWHLDCKEGEEWNIFYVLPQEGGQPTLLVVPTSLQMRQDIVAVIFLCSVRNRAQRCSLLH